MKMCAGSFTKSRASIDCHYDDRRTYNYFVFITFQEK